MHFKNFSENEFFDFSSLVNYQLTQRIERIREKIEQVQHLDLPATSNWITLAQNEIVALRNYLDTSDFIPLEATSLAKDQKTAQNLTKQWIKNYSNLLFHWKQIRKMSECPTMK